MIEFNNTILPYNSDDYNLLFLYLSTHNFVYKKCIYFEKKHEKICRLSNLIPTLVAMGIRV